MLYETEILLNKLASILTAIMFFLVTVYGETDIITVLFVGFAAIILLIKTKGQIEIKLEPYYIFGIIMIVFSAFSSLWALEPYYTNKMTRNLIVTFFCTFLIFLAYSKEEDTWPLMKCIKWSGYLMTLYQIREYGISRLFSMLMDMIRVNTERINANSLGMFIAFSCVFEIMEIAKKKKLTFSSPLLIPAVLVISATQSRKALIILIVGLILSFCLYSVDRRQVFKSFVSFALFLCIGYVLLQILNSLPLFTGISRRMEMLLNFLEDEEDIGHSLDVRQEMIEIGWQQFLKTPLLGVGIDNGQVVARLQTNGRMTAYLHNNYIELLCGGGIIGFMIYYSRYMYLIYCLVKNIHTQNDNYAPCVILIPILLIID